MKIIITTIICGLLFTSCGGDSNSLKKEVTKGKSEQTTNQKSISILKHIAVDIALTPVVQKKLGYTFELRSDSPTPTKLAKTSIAIWGKTSVTGEEIINLEAHNGYADGTRFQVVVKEGDRVIGASDEVEFSADVGDLEFSDIDVGGEG